MSGTGPGSDVEPATILVIDDNLINLRLASAVLEADGFTVTTALTGQEGLDRVRRDRPALAFCDLQLPDIDGIDVARTIKQDPDTADVVVIALTALAMEADRRRALAAGCDGFISKPINTRTLGADAERFIRQHRADA